MKLSTIYNTDNDDKLAEEILNTKWYMSGTRLLLRATNILQQNGLNGMELNITEEFRTKPIDSDVKSHTIANNKAVEKLGVKVRNGLFTTFDSGIAQEYSRYVGGMVCAVIPKDNAVLYASTEFEDFYADVVLTAERKLSNISDTVTSETIDEYLYNTLIPEYINSVENIPLSGVNMFYEKETEVIVFGGVYIVSLAFIRDHLPDRIQYI